MLELAPLVAVTWSCLTGAALILPFALHAGFLDEIRRIGGVNSGIFINLVPLFALLFSRLFLHEIPHSGELAGGLLVITGVITAVRANTPRQPAAAGR